MVMLSWTGAHPPSRAQNNPGKHQYLPPSPMSGHQAGAKIFSARLPVRQECRGCSSVVHLAGDGRAWQNRVEMVVEMAAVLKRIAFEQAKHYW
jgi:hypothetical protein